MSAIFNPDNNLTQNLQQNDGDLHISQQSQYLSRLNANTSNLDKNHSKEELKILSHGDESKKLKLKSQLLRAEKYLNMNQPGKRERYIKNRQKTLQEYSQFEVSPTIKKYTTNISIYEDTKVPPLVPTSTRTYRTKNELLPKTSRS